MDVEQLNTEKEWGTYVPGRRIEIAPHGWDRISAQGWGASSRPHPTKRVLEQRDVESPHPITWHSSTYSDVEEARTAFLTLRVNEVGSQREAYLLIPGVSEIAFNDHHSKVGGCKGGGSMGECREECVSRAVETVETVLAQRDLIEHGLRMIRTDPDAL